MIISKVSRTLNIILLALLLIAVRITFLTTTEHTKYEALSKKPRTRTLLERPHRGTITDRFGAPLALNKLQYNAMVLYQPLREMPRSKRRVYIPKLCDLLSRELNLPYQEIEDAIHAKASLFPNTPCLLKSDIHEQTYYRLKHLEQTYPGILCERSAKRVYPAKRVACDVLGTMGAIGEKEYFAFAGEMREIRSFLDDRDNAIPTPLPKGFNSVAEVRARLKHLSDRAYTMNTYVGKGGIEGKFEERLRGQIGRRRCEVDTKGRVIREIERIQEAVSGERIPLTISLDLQEYAETLLMENELVRDKHFHGAGKNHDKIPNPWIKGGAIVAIIPSTGEIVALASYPRFDPNAFIEKNASEIARFLEAPSHLAKLWDGLALLEKEAPSKTLTKKLSWELYIDTVLSKNSELKRLMGQIRTIRQAIDIQTMVSTLLSLSEQPYLHALFDTLYPSKPTNLNTTDAMRAHIEEALAGHFEQVKSMRVSLDPLLETLTYNEDKLLLIDLLNLAVDPHRFTPSLIEAHGSLSLSLYREFCQQTAKHLTAVREKLHDDFAANEFPRWRQDHFAAFLKDKRRQEKRWQRPYTDYLQQAFNAQFEAYYQSHIESHLSPLQMTVRLFEDYQEPLHRYPRLNQQKLIAQFLPKTGFGYGKSFAYKQHAPPGSLFKIITGFEALKQSGGVQNPLTLFDEGSPNSEVLGHSLEGRPIMRRYKGGRLPRSHSKIGRVDFRRAMQRSSNIYFSLLAGDHMETSEDLKTAAEEWGYGAPTGIELGGEVAGLLPNDLRGNKSAIYSFAIGQHTAAATPLQTAFMLATLANNGEKIQPHITVKPPMSLGRVEGDQALFTYMQDILKSVVASPEGGVHPSRIRLLYENPKMRPIYKRVYKELGGKTSTTEFTKRPCLNKDCPRAMCKDIWFGGFTNDLAVVVYLRYGDWGKEAAPLAAMIVDKWRQITSEK